MVTDDPPASPAATERTAGELRRARTVARVLDDLIPVPGTSWRVGLDPLFGLVPGLGDWIGWAASLHLLVSGARAGADAATLTRMAGNVLLDALAGVVPVLGDLFDLGWKANRRNLALLERVVADPSRTARASRGVVGTVIGGTVALLAGTSLASWLFLRWVLTTVGGWL
ncbi:MAG: DUF4112 domain-containing protein [Gemmatimonadetes bacterium]|nr:DUF4112 domain-containing protein [Gemmatimonadota bacterium]